jgi:Tol biopolymer transport system component
VHPHGCHSSGDRGVTPQVSRGPAGRPARLAYVRSFTDSNVWPLDVASPGAPAIAPPVSAVSSTFADGTAHVSGDGRRVTFVSNRSGEGEVWVADLDGASAVAVTSMSANPGFTRWSPDGQSIAFHSNPEGQAEVFVVPAGGGRVRNLTNHPALDTFPSFSRDGQWIYFSSLRSGERRIWKVPAGGGEAVQVTPGPALLALESVDGRSLHYVDAPTNHAAALMRLPLAGGSPVKVADDVLTESFEVLADGIYYIERVNDVSRNPLPGVRHRPVQHRRREPGQAGVRNHGDAGWPRDLLLARGSGGGRPDAGRELPLTFERPRP